MMYRWQSSRLLEPRSWGISSNLGKIYTFFVNSQYNDHYSSILIRFNVKISRHFEEQSALDSNIYAHPAHNPFHFRVYI